MSDIKYNEYFEAKHDQNREIVFLKEDSPKNLKDIVREIHQQFNVLFPNDWIYSTILEAFQMIELEYQEDTKKEVILSEVETDCYDKELIKWSMNSFAENIINEGTLDYGFKDFISSIKIGQTIAKERIYSIVYDFIKEGK